MSVCDAELNLGAHHIEWIPNTHYGFVEHLRLLLPEHDGYMTLVDPYIVIIVAFSFETTEG